MSTAFSSIGDVLGNIASGVGNVGKTIGSDIGGIFSGTTPSASTGGTSPAGGGLWGTLGKVLPLGLLGAGLAGNYLTNRKIGQVTDQQLAYQKYLQQLATNPAKFMQLAQGYTQPLTAGLTQGVLNQDQAWLAQHGLSQSPAIAGDIINQSLAPYIQQQQNQGVQDAMRALELGNNPQALSLLRSSPTDLTGLLKLLQGGTLGSVAPGPGSITNLGNFNPLNMGETMTPSTGLAPIDTTSLLNLSGGGGGGVDWSQFGDLSTLFGGGGS